MEPIVDRLAGLDAKQLGDLSHRQRLAAKPAALLERACQGPQLEFDGLRFGEAADTVSRKARFVSGVL